MRLDKAVAHLLGVSRSQAQNLISNLQIVLNGSVTKDNSKILKHGDKLSITPAQIKEIDHVRHDIVATNLPDIVYEDEDVIVLNKPCGLTVHPSESYRGFTLVDFLKQHCGNMLSHYAPERPGIVHRLDRDTSGLMIAAKNNKAHHFLSEQLQHKTINREYLAVVHGSLLKQSGDIVTLIGRDVSDRKKMRAYKLTDQRVGRRYARTRYELLQSFVFGRFSFIKATLDTGRTHQIRVHMSWIGHSVLGDQTYGHNSSKIQKIKSLLECNSKAYELIANYSKQALHAAHISFIHPGTKSTMSFDVGPPGEMRELLNCLGSYQA